MFIADFYVMNTIGGGIAHLVDGVNFTVFTSIAVVIESCNDSMMYFQDSSGGVVFSVAICPQQQCQIDITTSTNNTYSVTTLNTTLKLVNEPIPISICFIILWVIL